ncbi:Beta-1,3-galactosyltransferase 1, partial [Halocaridina rubra]
YLIQPERVCNERIKIVNVIPSSPSSTDARSVIRNLWGNLIYTNFTGMATYFLFGTTNSWHDLNQIYYESQTFHDIIQLDFHDSYENLSIKTLSIMHWTGYFCPQADWVLKSDEDVFIDPFAVSNFLADKLTHNDFICNLNRNLKVCRPGAKCEQRYAISRETYPENYYPPYCSGGGYIVRHEMARRIYKAANNSRLHPMEDAFFTGIVVQDLNPTYTVLSGRRLHYNRRRQKFLWWGYTLMYHKYPQNGTELWQKILKHNGFDI